jgi:tetratricopeptide (TPR) repeat protein
VQWTIYYPRTAGRRTSERQPPVEQCRPGLAGADCEIAKIETLLESGSTVEAEAAIDRLKVEGVGGADVAALDSIVRIARNELEQGLAIATKATESEPENERAWTALSYAKQAIYDVDGALAAAKRAADAAPTSSLAKAREAEMLLTAGRLKEAEVAALAARELDPNEPRALQILGFVQLARLDGRAATKSLQSALELDPADPRTRLGLGLAKVRQRKLAEGREDLEIAVALDPTSALTRTYLGRAYFEEKRKERALMAREQYRLASELDPEDPTPWFYEAVRKQSDNRPIEAVSDMRRSIQLNDQRSVYRPRSALDQDAAARGAALARLFTQLGFEESARAEVATALSEDPTSFAAQQYLSDIAAVADRQQSSRASAGLQAQLRAPLGADVPLVGLTSSNSLAPGRPYLSVDSIGPPRPGLYDFDPLFSGPGIRARARGLTGSFGTASHELSASATFDRSSVALGMFHAETNGQRVNNDQLRNAYAGLITLKPTAAMTLQVDMQQSEAKFGDLPIRWDPTFVAVNDRNTEQFSTGRVGMRGELTPDSEVLFTLTQAESKAELVDSV